MKRTIIKASLDRGVRASLSLDSCCVLVASDFAISLSFEPLLLRRFMGRIPQLFCFSVISTFRSVFGAFLCIGHCIAWRFFGSDQGRPQWLPARTHARPCTSFPQIPSQDLPRYLACRSRSGGLCSVRADVDFQTAVGRATGRRQEVRCNPQPAVFCVWCVRVGGGKGKSCRQKGYSACSALCESCTSAS